jgi:hypothetical protein
MYGLEGGIRNRAVTHLAGCLPYLWRTIKYEEVYVRTVQPKLATNEGMAGKEQTLTTDDPI